ncbi:putative protein isoform X1 [Capsicum galapagoense]
MGNIFTILNPILNGLMKIAGMTYQLVEIEPGTTMYFWVPTRSINPNNKLPNKPPKPAVVFVHGIIGSGLITWLFQILSLSSDFDVYVPNLIFLGDSITDRPERSTTFQAECLVKGLMKIGVEKFSLVGFTYGGMVGFKLAQLYPHMVESMVISSAVIEMTESVSNASLKNIGFTNWSDFLLPKTVTGVKVLLSTGTHKWPWLPKFFYKDFLEVMFDNRKEKEQILEALVVSDKDATITPSNYSQRIYLLYGDDDRIFNKKISDNMKEKLGKNATIQYVKNAGHLLQIEQPSTYNYYLKKFLSNS